MVVKIIGNNETAARARTYMHQGGGLLVEHGELYVFTVMEGDGDLVVVDGVDSPLEARFVTLLAELLAGGRVLLDRGGKNRDDRALAITVPRETGAREAVALAIYRATAQLSGPRPRRGWRRFLPMLAALLCIAAPAAAQGSGGVVDQGAAGTASWPVTCTSGCSGSGGGGLTDNSAFTLGTTSFSPIGGVFKDAATLLADGVAAAARLTAYRAVHVNLRDNSGNEILVSTAGNQSTEITKLTSVVGWLQLAHKATGVVYDTLGTNDGFGAMGVRNDAPIATGSVDGTFAYYSVGATGRLWTSATIDTALPAGTNTIGKVTQGTAAAATAPWPVYSGVPAQVSGNLVTTGDTVGATLVGAASVAVKFSIGGNCSGAGCNFVYEASLNNSDYNPVEAWTWQGSATLGATLLSPFITETTTAGTQTPGLSLISLPAGVTNFRVRRLDANTGTVAIIVAPSASPFSYPQTTLPSSTTQSVNLAQIAGSTIPQANGTTAFNTPRFTLSSDSTGHVELWDGTNTAAVKAASTIAAAADPSLVVAISPNSPLATGANTIGAVTQASGPWTSNVTQFAGSAVATGTGASGVGIPRVTVANDSNVIVTPPTLTKGTQGATGFSVQNLYDAGRSAKSFYANNVASGTTTTETLITLVQSSGTGATSSASTYTITNGKTFRITGLSVASRGNATATIQSTVFNLRLNTAGACVVTSTPILFAAQSATAAVASAWDRVIIPIPDGYEIAGNGTISICISAAATFTTNAPTWSVNLIGYEY